MLSIFVEYARNWGNVKGFLFGCARSPGNVKHFLVDLLETGEMSKVVLDIPETREMLNIFGVNFEKCLKPGKC